MVLPHPCLLCGAAVRGDGWLCAGCDGDLPRLPRSCDFCGAPVPRDVSLCGSCSLRGPGPADRVVVAFAYAYPVDVLVQAFKYRHRVQLAGLLGAGIADAVRNRGGELPDLLLPIPLHWTRFLARGYNQARELARVAGAGLGIAVAGGRLVRCRRTPFQVGQAAGARRRNLRGAFAVRGELEGLHVALVDDVLTTGATLEAAARALKDAGARCVEAWVAAHAGRPRVRRPGSPPTVRAAR